MINDSRLIINGSDDIILSFRVDWQEEWTAKADFTHHAHTASISVVASSDRFVVTGSKDETIQVYDMKKRVEHGALLHHDGKDLLYPCLSAPRKSR